MKKIYIVFNKGSELEGGLPVGISHEGGEPVIYSIAEGAQLPAGSRVATDEETESILVAAAQSMADKVKGWIQRKIANQYGIKGDNVSASLSVAGKLGDAISLNTDAMVHDVIAISETSDTAYSQARIRLFDELHGEGSWVKAVEFANTWHAGRSAKVIVMPADDKGTEEVVGELVALGSFVKTTISDAKKLFTPA